MASDLSDSVFLTIGRTPSNASAGRATPHICSTSETPLDSIGSLRICPNHLERGRERQYRVLTVGDDASGLVIVREKFFKMSPQLPD